MKKTLYALLILPFATLAQSPNGQNNGLKQSNSAAFKTESGLIEKDHSTDFIPSKTQKAEWLYNTTTIGETQYDLQVNSCLANRISLYDDGKVSATFIMSPDGSPFANRGMGYNHFDGSEWGETPLNRLEPARAGWGNLGTVEKDGKTVEFMVSHHWSADGSSTGGLYIMTNDGIGSSNFSVETTYKIDENGPAWPRAVGSGKYIHIYTSVTEGYYQGITRPNRYYRFNVETGEFDKERVLFDGYNADAVSTGQNDCYQMDVNGENIAIVTGGSGQNLYLFKSTDNGDNWTTTVVDSFGIQGYNGNQTTGIDTLPTNTGSVEVLLDNDGKAHVWWSVTSIFDEVENDSAWAFFPSANGIAHWSENDKSAQIVAQALDINGNDQLDLFTDQWQLNPGARYSNNSLACFPDAGIDADGNIFLVYSAPNEDALSPEGPVYRDVYIVYSQDGGSNWSDPQSLVENYETEDVYAHIARDVDDKLHIIWQRDDYAGTAVINGHVGTLSKILYAGIDKQDVLDNRFKLDRTSVAEQTTTNELAIYPNPSAGITTLQVNATKASTAQIKIVNTVGQVVDQKTVNLNEGNNKIDLNTQVLENGVYFVKMHSEKAVKTTSFIVKK